MADGHEHSNTVGRGARSGSHQSEDRRVDGDRWYSHATLFDRERAMRGWTPDEENRARKRVASHQKQTYGLGRAVYKFLGNPLKVTRMDTVDHCVCGVHTKINRAKGCGVPKGGKSVMNLEIPFVVYVLNTGRKYLDFTPIDQCLICI